MADSMSDSEKIELLRSELGINFDQLKFENEKHREAIRLEADQKKAEAEAAQAAAIRVARRKQIDAYLKEGIVRAWRTEPNKGLVEVHHTQDLVCPACGEQPDKVRQLLDIFADAVVTRNARAWASWSGMSMGVHAYLLPTPMFRVNVACKCGTRAVYAAVHVPETEIE